MSLGLGLKRKQRREKTTHTLELLQTTMITYGWAIEMEIIFIGR